MVNGRQEQLPDGATLTDLVARFKLGEKRIAVERNGEVVPRGRFADTQLAEGDRLEVVTLVGGG
jgi:sulfur carrier protein